MLVTIAIGLAAVLHSSQSAVSAQSVQAPGAERHFEVASVKPAVSLAELGRAAAVAGTASFSMRRFGIETLPGGRFTASTVTGKQLVAHAFDVKDYQMEGGPPWLTSDYFEVTATASADASPADIRSMLRTLLAERFGLRTHSDTRQASVYVLTLARSDGRLGPGLKRTTPECVMELEQRKSGAATVPTPSFNANHRPTTPTCGATTTMLSSNGASTLMLGGMELSALVSRISSELAAPVIDRTGLSGLFDITLEYMSQRQFGSRRPGLDPNSTEPLPAPIPAAIQPQLGLKLDKDTGPLPIVVIDAAERPMPD